QTGIYTLLPPLGSLPPPPPPPPSPPPPPYPPPPPAPPPPPPGHQPPVSPGQPAQPEQPECSQLLQSKQPWHSAHVIESLNGPVWRLAFLAKQLLGSEGLIVQHSP